MRIRRPANRNRVRRKHGNPPWMNPPQQLEPEKRVRFHWRRWGLDLGSDYAVTTKQGRRAKVTRTWRIGPLEILQLYSLPRIILNPGARR